MEYSKEKILIAGGTGLIGKRLIELIDPNLYFVTILTRNPSKQNTAFIKYELWNPEKGEMPEIGFHKHIINLVGEGIADQRWTDKRKKALIDSRVKSAATLQKFLEINQFKPSSYISASGIGYYGNRYNESLTEESVSGSDFLSECCVKWEKAALQASYNCDRAILLRIGIVLSNLGGALPKMMLTRRIGLFNYFGKGYQIQPWIHIDDLSRIILEGISNRNINGIYNAVSPQVISNKTMIKSIKTQLCKFGILLPIPIWLLRVLMGEMADLLLNSTRLTSQKIQKTGFKFNFPNIEIALADLLKK